jgi:hypothetical protein
MDQHGKLIAFIVVPKTSGHGVCKVTIASWPDIYRGECDTAKRHYLDMLADKLLLTWVFVPDSEFIGE